MKSAVVACCFIVLVIPSTLGTKLFTYDLAVRSLPDCDQSVHLECRKVFVNFATLTDSDDLELFDGIRLSRKTERQMRDGSMQLQLQNKALGIEATLHFGVQDDQKWISGSVNWDKAGRHFRLDKLKDRSGFGWFEMNSHHWFELSKGDRILYAPQQEINLNEEQLRLLEMGHTDRMTPTIVTITIYTTPQFRASFPDGTSMSAFINQALAETNTGYANSQVPIYLLLHCIVDSDIDEDPTMLATLQQILISVGGDFNTVRRSADLALVLTTSTEACGIGYFDTISSGITLGVVHKSCATGYYTFGHEIAHMYGCHHNQESGTTNPAYPTAYGFLMRPPINSGYRTILAYHDDNYSNRVNYYSNPDIQFSGIPTGDADNNNAQLLVERRFLMSAVGNEDMACPPGAR